MMTIIKMKVLNSKFLFISEKNFYRYIDLHIRNIFNGE